MKKNCILSLFLCFSSAAYAADWTTSADLRLRYQSFNNADFNSVVNDHKQEVNSRLYLKAQKDFSDHFRVFLQSQTIISKLKDPVNGRSNLSQADLLQAYVAYQVNDFTVRLGRQQLVYGDQRLLGHLAWKDVARTFDGVKAMYHAGAMKLDVFAVHPADMVAMTPTAASPQGKSLTTWEDRSLLGAYATYTLAPKVGIDGYLINWSHSQQAIVAKGRNINTFGARVFAQGRGFDATAEAVFQSGTWKTGVSQSASAFAVKAGYTLDAWNSRFGLEYDYSPGDTKANANAHKDFVFPFHTNHAHYGEMDFFSWANMRDLRLSLKTSPTKGLSFLANVHVLSLDKPTGDWLNVAGVGTVFKGAPGYTQTKAGTEVDLKVVYKMPEVKGLKVVALYGVFNPGAAVVERNAGKADTASFAYLMTQYAF